MKGWNKRLLLLDDISLGRDRMASLTDGELVSMNGKLSRSQQHDATPPRNGTGCVVPWCHLYFASAYKLLGEAGEIA